MLGVRVPRVNQDNRTELSAVMQDPGAFVDEVGWRLRKQCRPRKSTDTCFLGLCSSASALHGCNTEVINQDVHEGAMRADNT